MKEKKDGQQNNQPAGIVEDLTISEVESANIKGGPSDYLLTLDGIKGESSDAPLLTTYDLKTAKK